MRYFFKIKSITDVITNSSTEVFLLHNDEKTQEVLNKLRYVDIITFKTEKDVKDFIQANLYDLPNRQYFPSSIVKVDPLSEWSFVDMINEIGKSFDEMWEFVKSCYLPLIGYTYIECEDSCCGTEIGNELDILQSLCYHNDNCFFDRC